jgi:hypothetical protein
VFSTSVLFSAGCPTASAERDALVRGGQSRTGRVKMTTCANASPEGQGLNGMNRWLRVSTISLDGSGNVVYSNSLPYSQRAAVLAIQVVRNQAAVRRDARRDRRPNARRSRPWSRPSCRPRPHGRPEHDAVARGSAPEVFPDNPLLWQRFILLCRQGIVACVRTAGIVGLVARKRAPTSAVPGGLEEPACGRRAGYTTRIDHGETVQMPKRFAGIPQDQRPLFFPSMMTTPHCSISPLRAERDGGSASSVGMTMRLILADGY